MSPLSANLLNLDLIEHFGFPTILVSQNYLGSINHTLLSFEALKSRNINILGIVFNGMVVPASEEYILGYTNLKMLFRLPEFKNINSNTITDFCTTLKIDF
jgi:dethiobiotin synthetase